MTHESEGDVDAAVHDVIDDVTARVATLSCPQIRTALASGLAAIGASLPAYELDAWSRALAGGGGLFACDHYR